MHGKATSSSLVERIKEAQAGDKQLQKFKERVKAGLRSDWSFIRMDPSSMVQGCACQQEKLDKNY